MFLLLITLFLLTIRTSVYSQIGDCKILEKIEVEIQDSEDENGGKNITLKIPEGTTMASVKIHLFAPGKANNRINIQEREIKGLSTGKYLLVIQSEKDANCTRKISLEIN